MKESWDLLWFQRASDSDRLWQGSSHIKALRSIHETLKVYLRLHWRSEDAGDANVMRCLQRRPACGD